MTKVAASILTADFGYLAAELQSFERAGIDYIHFDVMDGIFVDNISIGLPVLESLKKHTNIPIEAHLMIQNPAKYITQFAKCGVDNISIHVECDTHCNITDTLKLIRDTGTKSCITLRPSTKIESLLPHLPYCDRVLMMSVNPGFGGQSFDMNVIDRLAKLITIRNENLFNFDIEIDGGINSETAKIAINAGCDVLVIGNALITAPDRTQFVKQIKSIK